MRDRIIDIFEESNDPARVASGLFELANQDFSAFKKAIGELPEIMCSASGWIKTQLDDRIAAAETAAALAKAGDNSRLRMVLMLLYDRDTAYNALELIKWLGEDVQLAKDNVKNAAFREIWRIARESDSTVEKNLAMECLVLFHPAADQREKLARLAKEDFGKNPSLANASLLALVATEYHDIEPLMEPLEKYSDKKSFFAMAGKWLSVTWNVPIGLILVDLTARLVALTVAGIKPPPTQQLAQEIGLLLAISAALGVPLLVSACQRGSLRKKCSEGLKALASVQDWKIAAEVLKNAKEFLSFPGEPNSNFLWNVTLRILTIPSTVLFFAVPLCFNTNLIIRDSLLTLAETYRKKFSSCRRHAKELAQKMADITTTPFFRGWAEPLDTWLKFFTNWKLEGPYKSMLQRLKNSFGIDILLEEPAKKMHVNAGQPPAED